MYSKEIFFSSLFFPITSLQIQNMYSVITWTFTHLGLVELFTGWGDSRSISGELNTAQYLSETEKIEMMGEGQENPVTLWKNEP